MTTPATFQELFEQRTTSNLEKLRELVALGVAFWNRPKHPLKRPGSAARRRRKPP